jgi:tRNA threonylcarbamoyladenosine biosynthesis protein TsaB
LDGATPVFTIAARSADKTVTTSLGLGTRYSEHLLPEVIHVLEVLGVGPTELEYIVVDEGPGAFTGLRLAYVTAKALSLAGGIPVYAVPTLQAFAHPFRALSGAVVPCLDAKQGRFFTAVFRRGLQCAPTLARTPAEIAALLDAEEEVFVLGSADAPLLAALLSEVCPVGRFTVLYDTPPATNALFELAEAAPVPLEIWAGPEYYAGI